MEIDEHRQISAYNRYRSNEDLRIVACTCQNQSSLAIQSHLSGKVSFSSLELPFQNDNANIDIVENTLKDVLCTVFLVCHHFRENILNVISDWEPEITSRIVIVYTSRTLALPTGIQSVYLDSHNYCQEVLDKALDVLRKQSLYDDFSLGNMDTMNTSINTFEVYQNEDSSGIYESCSYPFYSNDETFRKSTHVSSISNSNASEDETEVKETVQSRKDITNEANHGLKRERNKDEQNPYQSLSTCKREKLVNLANGGEALEEFCSPFHVYNKRAETIVEDINTGERALVMDLIKHVHAVAIPSAVSQIDLRALSILSDCYNNGIERGTSREIQNILFKTEVGRHNLEALLESVDLLLGVVRRRAASSDTLLNTLPNVIVMLALSHHLLLSHHDKASVSEIVRTRIQNFLVLLEEIEYPQNNETELYLLNAVKTMISGLEKVMTGKKANRLQIGSWKDELQKESCRTKIGRSLMKMAVFEHYSLIIRLIIELHLRLIEKNVEFLFASLMSIKSAMKKTDGHILYPLLVVVFRGITSLLNNHIQQNHHRDEVQDNIHKTCIDMLKKCLGSAKVSLECKQDLRENLNSLLFHKRKWIANAVSTLMAAADGRFCLAEKVYPHMKTILEPLSFSINSESLESQCLPRWENVSGTITGHKEVSVHVLLPANGTCDLQQYHKSVAKDKKAGMHCNTLDVLRSLLGTEQHPNMKRLIAFHLQAIPMFYMTEKLSDASLSTYLLRERKDRSWLPARTLGSIALDCVRAVDFLHERKIIHRNITASSFCYRGEHTNFVLSDFSIAKAIDDGSNGSSTFIQDIEGNLIPTRWSSPESLIDDRYDVMSDTWMLGQLLTEIFTHGCHPFPEMCAFEFDDLMDMVVFHDLKPRRWPCIPLPVHNITLQCLETKPHSRIKPKEVLEKLNNWMASPDESDGHLPKSSIEAFANKILNYPELDPNQKEPERGSTEQLKQLKNMRGNPRVSYYNKASKRRLSSFVRRCCIREQDLTAPDHPIIKEKGLYLEIEEPVTKAFMGETFPKLCNKFALSELLHIATFPPEHHKRDCTNPEGLTHALLYRCKRADSLLNIAATCSLGDPEDNEMPYLQVVYELVQFVNAMHKNCWILRDLCCSTLYRSQVHDKVFMPRVGRMLKIEKRNLWIEACIIDKSTCVDDRRNWMPAEVIQSGQFSQASDVYMMAMTIYQFYSTASLFKSNPTASRLEAVPFCKVEPEKLLETLYRGEVPEEPDSCPAWLFEIMKECWNRDSTKRPSTDYILEKINNRFIYTDDSTFESMSSEDTSPSAGSVLFRDSREHNATRLPNVPLAEETDRPLRPPRPKRAKSRPVPIQENDHFNVNTIVFIDQNTVQGRPSTDVSSCVTRNDVATAPSSNQDDLCVSCANSNDGTYVNSVSGSLNASIQTPERKSTRTHVASIFGHSNPSLHDKKIARSFEGDMPGYLDLDQSPNKEACARTVAIAKPPEEFKDSLHEIIIVQTAFKDDNAGYQDFDQQTEEGTTGSDDLDMGEQDVIPNPPNSSLRNRLMQALPQVTRKHDVSRTSSTITNGSSNDSAISCANSETLEPVSDVYDYATTISNPPNSSVRDRHRQALPHVSVNSGNHYVSRTASMVTNGSSNDSEISCANSEAIENDYDYIPLE
ncbi:Tyrosine-protein kinase Fer [Mizuhopecten yessoensis]|uniref:Tyrosine-protein kinase Fer n=1 Tax=Mizuhopecten yessoensis TaxID=6573 RepID=A0A210Q8M1_MIZYE|nr:Tyrosine-protein kinase Fer [Mizuhopecten yessoensis]